MSATEERTEAGSGERSAKTMRIPEHTEPDAARLLIQALKQALNSIQPEPREFMNSVLAGSNLNQPYFGSHIVSFLDRSQHLYGVPLRVEVFQGSNLDEDGYARAYVFKDDGEVEVERPRVAGHALLAQPLCTLHGWPKGVQHMIRHIVMTLLQSATWENETADKLLDLFF